jgi:DNA-binding CsgD family transcriptional regulator
MLALVQLIRGAEALADGRHLAAYEQLYPIFDPGEVPYHPLVQFWALSNLAEAAVACGRADDLRELVEELTPIGTFPVLRVALNYCAPLLAADGDAEAAFETALAADYLAAWPLERARLQHAYGAWLRRQRRVTESRPHLRAATAAFDALGVRPWADRARAELRASGERVRRHPDARDRLTPQELQIAQLAGDGLSNRDIAGRLFLSPRTISTHLYRIFPKLGVTSRAELARVLQSPSAI